MRTDQFSAKENAMRPLRKNKGLPPRQGLYDPAQEHDACGVGFVVNMRGEKSHQIVRSGLEILVNLTHRGACGCDPLTGDGAGILTQIPHEFFAAKRGRSWASSCRRPGDYGVGTVFLPRDATERRHCEAALRARSSPKKGRSSSAGATCRSTTRARAHGPRRRAGIRQVFVARGDDTPRRHVRVEAVRHSQAARNGDRRQRRCRKRSYCYVPSLSSRVIVYKGLLLADQVERSTPTWPTSDSSSALALVHQRYSTNTFPTWDLAHPFRYLAHNGEINTLRGNVNWMHARRACSPARSTATTEEDLADVHRRAPATRPCSTTRWNCWCSPAARCRRRCRC